MVEFYPEYANGQMTKVPYSEIPVLKPRECLKNEKEFEGGRFMKPLKGRTVKKGTQYPPKTTDFKEDSLYPVFPCPGALKIKELVA